MPHLQAPTTDSSKLAKLFDWLLDATPAERQTLFAGGLG